MTPRVLGAHQGLPQGDDKRRSVEAMFDRVAPRYERMNRVISLGLDRRWREHAVVALGLPARLACPRPRLRDRRPLPGSAAERVRAGGDRLLGRDAHRRAHQRTAGARGRRVPPLSSAGFDGVVCGFALRNFVDLESVFAECARVLRRGGRFAAIDAAVPENPFLRAGNAIWFRGAVPLLGRVLAHDADAYRYLPKSTAYLPTTGELARRLAGSGFTDVATADFTGGSVLLVTGTRA